MTPIPLEKPPIEAHCFVKAHDFRPQGRMIMTIAAKPHRTLFKGGLVLSLDAKLGDHAGADVLVTADPITAVGATCPRKTPR